MNMQARKQQITSMGNAGSCLGTEVNNALILGLGIIAGLTLRKGHIA